MTVRRENGLVKVDPACCYIRLIVAETALAAAELSDMRVLIILILKRFAAERTESAL